MTKDRIYILLIAIVILAASIGMILLNNNFLISRIDQDRTTRVIELDQKIQDLQSRLDLTVARVRSLEKVAFPSVSKSPATPAAH